MNKVLKITPYSFKSELKNPVLFAIIILLLITSLTIIFLGSLRTKTTKEKKDYLIERAAYRAALVKERIDEDFDDLIIISHTISSDESLMTPSNFELLKFLKKSNNFRSLGIAELNGKAITTDNKVLNVIDDPLFIDIMNGSKKVFSSSHPDQTGKHEISVLAVPIYKSFKRKEIRGVLFATIEKNVYNRILYLPSLNYKSNNYIVQAPIKRVIYADEHGIAGELNLPSISKILDKYSPETIPEVKLDVKKNQGGMIYGNIENKKFYFTYAPIGFKNWYLLNITPVESFSEEFSKFLTVVLVFSILLIIVIFNLFYSYMRIYLKMYKAESLLRSINATIGKTFILGRIKKAIVTDVGKSFEADACLIKDYDPFNDRFCSNRLSEYFKDPEKFLPETFRCDNGKIAPNVLENGYYIIEDMRKLVETEEYKNDYYVNALREAGLVCGIRLPIVYNGFLLGILSLSYKRLHKFSKYEIALLKIVATQIATAIKQASLYQRTIQSAKQEKLLKEILSISKMDLEIDDMLQLVCEKIAHALDISGIKILKVIDFARKEFKSFAYMQDKKLSLMLNDITRSDILDYWLKVTSSFEPKIIADIGNSDMPESVQEYYAFYGLRSVACIPLRSVNSNVYIFFGNHFREKQWTPQNIQTMNFVQDYMTILLKEKDLYNETKYLANVSHELKTPVAVINNYTELLLEEENLSEVSKKYLYKIKTNIDRMIELINDVLSISKLEENIRTSNISFQKYNLKTVINKAIEQCSLNATQKKMYIEFEPQEDVELEMEPSLMQQAFVNLITNSIKYSDANKTIKIGIFKEDDKVKVKIKDEGYGIPINDFKNIFKRFYRVEKSRSRLKGGVGLGLTIVDKIIKFHGGQINVESVLSVGTTFTLTFNI